jgi:ATP-dependent RNA helicase SUPV3L1/SUV3
MEVFYTFTWGRARQQKHADSRPRKQGGAPKGKGKPRGKPQAGGNKAQNFSARPPKAEKKIDPDNPFAAALAGFGKK